jgi:hypothetical protein
LTNGNRESLKDNMVVAMAKLKNQRRGKVKRLVIEIPESLHKEIKVQAALEGRHVKDVVMGLVEGYMQSIRERGQDKMVDQKRSRS